MNKNHHLLRIIIYDIISIQIMHISHNATV